MKKYTWNTHQIVQETPDSISIYFDTQKEVFEFLPGQFINVSCVIDGDTVTRSYSLSSDPTAVYPAITVKRVKDGVMSNYLLDQAQAITSWDIQGPFGNFVLDKQIAEQSPIVLLGGGSGISPLFSMLYSAINKKIVPLLLYSNRTVDQTIFFKEIETLKRQGLVEVMYSFTSENLDYKEDDYIQGRFSIESIQNLLKGYKEYEQAHYYICGPTGLIKLYHTALLELGISSEQIHAEYFEIEEEKGKVIQNTATDIFVHYYEDTLRNNELETYECTSMIQVQANQSLLEAICAHRISVPSSCKNGTCGACWAVKTDGEVKMKSNHVLSEANITEGIILLCQSYPMDQDVTVSLLG